MTTESKTDQTDPGSRTTVHALSKMIKDLEEQLDRMIAINEAIEGDLSRERTRAMELERNVEQLTAQLRRAEQDAASKDDLRGELGHLKGERAKLAEAVDGLRQRLEAAEKAVAARDRLIERLRVGRTDAIEELDNVEVQFQRAMELVADLKTRLAVVTEDYEAMRQQVRANDDKLERLERERNSLLAEVEESRAALDDIRRSLVDACVVSQQHLEDEGRAGQAE